MESSKWWKTKSEQRQNNIMTSDRLQESMTWCMFERKVKMSNHLRDKRLLWNPAYVTYRHVNQCKHRKLMRKYIKKAYFTWKYFHSAFEFITLVTWGKLMTLRWWQHVVQQLTCSGYDNTGHLSGKIILQEHFCLHKNTITVVDFQSSIHLHII